MPPLIWSPQHQVGEGRLDPLERGLVRVEEEGVTLLGTPLGRNVFVSREVERKVEKIRDTPSGSTH